MKRLLVLLFIFNSLISVSQESCGFDKILQRLHEDPIASAAIQRDNKNISQYIKNNNGTNLRLNSDYTIPVVVHIVHAGDPLGSDFNPTDIQVREVINYLNSVYNGTYPGTAGVGNLQIQFALAKRDEAGNCTNGIVRINAASLSGYQSYGVNHYNNNGCSEAALKDFSKWNPGKYYNIWVVRKIDGQDSPSDGVQGWAWPPIGTFSTADYDGIVIKAKSFKSGKIILPHEMGHALNLYHVYHGGETNCPINSDCDSQGDRVCDTDPVKEPSAVACRLGINPCTLALFNSNTEKNYMNKTSCYNLFTAGQKALMQIAMTYPLRARLVSNNDALMPSNDITIMNASISNDNPSAGNNISVNCAEFNNYISLSSSNTIKIYISDYVLFSTANSTYLGQIIVPSISALGTGLMTAQINIPANTTSGQHFIHIWADANQSISECNEFNNTASFAINVTSGGGCTPPSNDLCSSNVPTLSIGSDCIYRSGDIACATQSYPASGCPSGLIQDVWYKFTANSTETYTVTLNPSNGMDGVVEVREGSCSGSTRWCRDVGGGNGAPEYLDVPVTNGTTYYVRVYEFNLPGNTTPPSTTTFNICVAPNAPVTEINSFTITPSSVTRPGTFTLTYNINSSVPRTVMLGTSIRPSGTPYFYDDTPSDIKINLQSGTHNYSRVFNINCEPIGLHDVFVAIWDDVNNNDFIDVNLDTEIWSISSNQILTINPENLPPPVATNPTAFTTNSFIANWNAVPNAIGYFLDLSTSPSFNNFIYQDVITNATSHNFTDLSCGTIYYYRLRSINSCTQSNYSSTYSVTTNQCCTSPSIPTVNNATNITQTSFIANWNSVTGATGYYLDVAASSSFGSYIIHDLPVVGLSQNITGLSCGNTYYYRVRAYNNCGNESPYSSTKSANTSVCCNPPPIPVATAASYESFTAFQANWNSVSGATFYVLDVATDPLFTNYVSGYQNRDVGNVNYFGVYPLICGTTYYYRVKSSNGCNTSAPSGTISISTLACCPPISAPTAIYGSDNCPGVALTGTQTANLSFTGNGGVSYNGLVRKYPYTTNVIATDCFSNSPLVVSNLAKGMLYKWDLNGYSNSNCASCQSNLSNSKFFHLPPEITYSGSVPATPITICLGSSITLSTIQQSPGTGAMVNYKWYKDGLIDQQGSNLTSINVSSKGSYSLVIDYSGSSVCPGIVSTNLSNIVSININYQTTWTGTVNNSWHTPQNWSCGMVPNANSEVYINAGAPFNCTINSPAVCKKLTLGNGANLINKNQLTVLQ